MRYADPLDADVLLTDGTVAVVRGVLTGDHDGLAALHEGASLASLRMRFFATGVPRGSGSTASASVTTSSMLWISRTVFGPRATAGRGRFGK